MRASGEYTEEEIKLLPCPMRENQMCNASKCPGWRMSGYDKPWESEENNQPYVAVGYCGYAGPPRGGGAIG